MTNVPKVSFSQVQTFLRCRKKWQYGYVRGLVPRETPKSFEMGSYVHGKLDVYYQLFQQTQEPEELWKLMSALTMEDLDMDSGKNGEIISRAIKVLHKYIHTYSPMIDKGIEVVGSELYFDVPMTTPKGRPFTLEGYVDLLYRRQEQLIERDHKTTGKPGNFRKQGETTYDVQQPTYVGGLRKINYPVFRGEVNEIITFNYKEYISEPLDKVMRLTPIYHTDAAINAAMLWYGRVVDQMIDEGEFLPSREGGCKYCWYKDPCTFVMEGRNDEALLSVAFVKKTARDRSDVNPTHQ